MRHDWRFNARVDTSTAFWASDWNRYSSGYLQAGEILLEQLREDYTRRDHLVYPIVFLYRHFLELRLKEICQRAEILRGDWEDTNMNHDLLALWKRARPKIEKEFEGDDPKVLDRIEMNITKVHQLDPKSMSFRYPVDKKQRPSVTGREFLNPFEFVDSLAETIETLNGVTAGLLVALDYQNDYGDGE